MAKSNLLTRIFSRKARLDHPLAEKRLLALESVEDSDQTSFESIAREDEDGAVRIAALKRVSNLDVVAEFIDDPTLESVAIEMVGSQIDPDHALARHAKVQQYLLERVDNVDLLLQMALAQSEPAQIAETLFTPRATQIVAGAVERVSNVDVLGHCERLSRNREKSINRNVRERLADVKKLQTNRDETFKRAEDLIESASRASAADSNYDSLRDAQEASWDQLLTELGNLNDALHEFDVEKIDLLMLQTRFPKRARAHHTEQENPQRFAEILGSLKQANGDTDALENAEQEWLEALRVQRAPVDLSNEFFDLISRIRGQAKRTSTKDKLTARYERIATIELELPDLQEKTNWSVLWKVRGQSRDHIKSIERFLDQSSFEALDANTQDEWRQRLESVSKHYRHLISEADKLFNETVDSVNAEIPKLEASLKEGASKSAVLMERRIRNLILRLPENSRRKHFDDLAPYAAELKQFMTWKSFATQPKREQLCQEIEALRDNPLEPSQHFETVKSLRHSWNALGPPSSKDDIALQHRYDLAAEEAWKVCEAWFEEQHEERKANGEKKLALARELETVVAETNWAEADWKSIQSHLSKRFKQYRDIGPVERKETKEINNRFFGAYKNLRERVTEHKKGVAASKEELIKRAQALIDDQSLENSQRLGGIKNLQKEWREAGSTFYKEEERLWGEFREICNSAFENLRIAKEERKETIAKNIDDARELVDKLLKDAQSSDLELSKDEAARVESKVDDMFLPTHVRRNLHRKLAQVDDLLDDRKHVVRQMQLSDRLKLLLEKDTELAGFEASDSPIPMTWFDEVQSDSVWFESRLAGDNESALRDVVLRAEIAADIPAADEADESRRLQLRVGALALDMKSGKQSKQEVAEELVKDWVGLAHGEQDMRPRFQEAMAAVLKGLRD